MDKITHEVCLANWKTTLVTAIHLLSLVAATVIITFETLQFEVSQVVIHLDFHHFFDSPAKQVFQSILNALCRLNVVLLQQLTDNVSFSFCHLYFVYRFLFSCHNKRPPMIFILSQKTFHVFFYRKTFTDSAVYRGADDLTFTLATTQSINYLLLLIN